MFHMPISHIQIGASAYPLDEGSTETSRHTRSRYRHRTHQDPLIVTVSPDHEWTHLIPFTSNLRRWQAYTDLLPPYQEIPVLPLLWLPRSALTMTPGQARVLQAVSFDSQSSASHALESALSNGIMVHLTDQGRVLNQPWTVIAACETMGLTAVPVTSSLPILTRYLPHTPPVHDTPTPSPPPIWKAGRKAIHYAPQQAWRCYYCQAPLLPERPPELPLADWLPYRATIDHVVPKCRGGANAQRNYVAACYACNNAKGSRLRWIASPEQLARAMAYESTLRHLGVPIPGECSSVDAGHLLSATPSDGIS